MAVVFLAGKKLRAQDLQNLQNRVDNMVLPYGFKDFTSLGSTGATVGVYRHDAIQVVSGLGYDINLTFHPNSTVGTDVLRFEIRFLFGGGVCTTADAIIPGCQGFVPVGATKKFSFVWRPASTGPVSLLASTARTGGIGTTDWFCDTNRKTEFYIEPKGEVTVTGTAI